MLVAFSVAPSSNHPDASVHDAVARAVQIVRDSGLPNRTDAMFTTIEGTWDECMDVVRRCSEAMLEFGPRVSLVLKADIRPGHSGELDGKLVRLEEALTRASADDS
ncbi:thiamine-binding protein [Tessaracoccus sp. SD287]|uniref:thiamine-binding protein n=1 Tax=Tessaracoccus sp. SD287 TaxID=2782008 RepID=UPI001A970F3F|nr:thiamine-binding protein [Tessaracoccus sp. SD287]MBO1030615.1 thiamine-binding protein [Tessaracoccus sp. SD287]